MYASGCGRCGRNLKPCGLSVVSWVDIACNVGNVGNVDNGGNAYGSDRQRTSTDFFFETVAHGAMSNVQSKLSLKRWVEGAQ